ncbi:hypothetical protein D3C73_1493770 [compost metagenome]
MLAMASRNAFSRWLCSQESQASSASPKTASAPLMFLAKLTAPQGLNLSILPKSSPTVLATATMPSRVASTVPLLISLLLSA